MGPLREVILIGATIFLMGIIAGSCATTAAPGSIVIAEPKHPSEIWIGSEEYGLTAVCVEIYPPEELVKFRCLTVDDLRALVAHIRRDSVMK